MDTTAEPVQTAPDNQPTGAETTAVAEAPATHESSETQPENPVSEREQNRRNLEASMAAQVAESEGQQESSAPTEEAKPEADKPTTDAQEEPTPGEEPAGEEPEAKTEGEQEPEGDEPPETDRMPERMRLGYLEKLGDEVGVEAAKIMARDRVKMETAMKMARVKLGIPEPDAAKPDAEPQPDKAEDAPQAPETSAEIEQRIKKLEADRKAAKDDFESEADPFEIEREIVRMEYKLASAQEREAREAQAQQEADRKAAEARQSAEAESLEATEKAYPDAWVKGSKLHEAAGDELDALIAADPTWETDPLRVEVAVSRAARKLGIAPQGASTKPATKSAPDKKLTEAPKPPAASPRTPPPVGPATNEPPTPNGFTSVEQIERTYSSNGERRRAMRALIDSQPAPG